MSRLLAVLLPCVLSLPAAHAATSPLAPFREQQVWVGEGITVETSLSVPNLFLQVASETTLGVASQHRGTLDLSTPRAR